MLAPAGTPKVSLAKLHSEIVRILNLPELKERLSAEGAAIVASTPEQFLRQSRQGFRHDGDELIYVNVKR
jgi:tripartite-type tricarboxylate transporter receptor subunit TctC